MSQKDTIRQEVNESELNAIAGGAKQNQQGNSNDRGQQVNTQDGDVYNEIMQQNTVTENSGDVKIGSPVVSKNGAFSTTTIIIN